MKLKNKLIAALAIVGLTASASYAQVLVSGWDFSQYAGDGANSSDGVAFTNVYNANYSSFDATFGAGAESAAFGKLYYNGLFGSTNVDAGVSDEFLPTSGSLSSNINAGGPFDRLSTLQSEGQTFAELLSLKQNGVGSVVFSADLTSAALKGQNWTFTLGAKTQVSGTNSIGLEFSNDGVSWTSAGTFNIGAVDTAYSVAVAGNETSTAYMRLNYLTVDANGFNSALIDNVSFSVGSTSPIPEPSTYAAILGGLTLGFVAIRRRFQAKAA
jgi:hypothetical protein